MKALVACPPTLGMINHFEPLFEKHEMKLSAPKGLQTMPVEELDVPTTNTPNMFVGMDVTLAMGYVIPLARETIQINEGVRRGEWPKPRGISLFGKTAALIGFGDFGKSTSKLSLTADMKTFDYDPTAPASPAPDTEDPKALPARLPEADFIGVTSSLTPTSPNMVDAGVFAQARHGVLVVNDGREPTVDEPALKVVRKSGKDYSAALQGCEVRPLPTDSDLCIHPRCIFGSHNASNTADAVERTSEIAIKELEGCLHAE